MPHRCAAMTAYRAVRRGADLRYGESMAVVATGAGSNILHFARAMGSDPHHCHRCQRRRLGAWRHPYRQLRHARR
ncbi:hypothetical protein PAST3_10487 [Cutibacterium acnes HL201PA1]|nr:hypothetical protein PAST3_10487 [Cutibacterium acnes HL201PA1]